MAYIGQGLPADVFAGFTIDKFTGTGVASQTLTLSKAPLGVVVPTPTCANI